MGCVAERGGGEEECEGSEDVGEGGPDEEGGAEESEEEDEEVEGGGGGGVLAGGADGDAGEEVAVDAAAAAGGRGVAPRRLGRGGVAARGRAEGGWQRAEEHYVCLGRP